MRRWNEATGRKPNLWQIRAEEDTHRHLLIVCGRRSGKTDEAANMALAGSEQDGLPEWVIGATFDTADLLFGQCWVTARSLGLFDAVESSYAAGVLVSDSGGVIERRSADSKRGNIGVKLRRLFADEVCRWSHGQRVWSQDLRPTLTDYRGEAVWTTTPSGWDFVHRLHSRILGGLEPDWGFVSAPSWENPYVYPGGRNDPEIVSVEREYEQAGVPELFAQEYGAEFTILSGVVFRKWKPATMVVPYREAVKNISEWWLGYDWGWNHPAVFILCGRTSGGLWRAVDEDYGQGESPEEILNRAFAILQRNNIAPAQVEQLLYDPSRPEQGAMFRRGDARGKFSARAADYGLADRILAVGTAIGKPGGLLLSDRCKRLAVELSTYRHPDDFRGGDVKVVKIDDDGVDALAGVLATAAKRARKGGLAVAYAH